jgi:DNA-binding response OmpR family regulator
LKLGFKCLSILYSLFLFVFNKKVVDFIGVIRPVVVEMAKRVMIVDDDEYFRGSISNILKLHGFQVFTAVNGMDCIDRLRRFKVDLVLIELLLPVLSGIETIKVIRRDDRLKDIKVAVLTVIDLDGKPLSYLKKLGVSDVLFKPYEVGDLVYRIERILTSG